MRMLRLRRSTSPELMQEPGPSASELRTILEIGARVPDHRRVYPFRFIVFEGDRRAAAGAVFAARLEATDPAADAAKIDVERRRFLRAPVVVCVVSRVDAAHKTPEWEQVLTAGAVCENLLLAASAHGFASCWLTEWLAYDSAVRAALGLGAEERVAGFIYIGSARENPKERPRPDVDALITRF
ncbi:MAG: nitroreductase [Parvularculaceae bacterium]|nr:nitroreductase [Parvularculaceae bacterium]